LVLRHSVGIHEQVIAAIYPTAGQIGGIFNDEVIVEGNASVIGDQGAALRIGSIVVEIIVNDGS
jgi:hypothetical protein